MRSVEASTPPVIDKGGRVVYKRAVRFTFIGAYDPLYPRNAVLRKGLRRLGVAVRERRASAGLKFWARYPLLLAGGWGGRAGGGAGAAPDVFFVPEFGQKDVPLAKFLGLLAARKVVFDTLAARFETKIGDWRRKPADSPAAWLNKRIDAAAFLLSDLVLADTAAHKEYYCREYGLKPEKVTILPVGYDDEVFVGSESPAGGKAGVFTVLFFGSFLPLHGAEVIVEIARVVATRDVRVQFVMLGEGQTLPAVKAAAARAGLRNIEFVGRKPYRQLPSAIASADLCLGIFGRTEKARRVVPHKIYQSMAMGRAVLTARTPAVEEFFSDGENIVLCGEPLAETAADAILALKGDPARRGRLARAGWDLVRRDFSPEALARRLLNVLKKTIRSGTL